MYYVLTDAVLSSAPTIVDLKFVTCPSLPACILNKITIAMNAGQLAYTFIKLGDNLTNNDRDTLINWHLKFDVKHSPFGKHAEWAKKTGMPKCSHWWNTAILCVHLFVKLHMKRLLLPGLLNFLSLSTAARILLWSASLSPSAQTINSNQFTQCRVFDNNSLQKIRGGILTLGGARLLLLVHFFCRVLLSYANDATPTSRQKSQV